MNTDVTGNPRDLVSKSIALAMMDHSSEMKKVHDTYPDGKEEDASIDSASTARRPSITGAINYARTRPFRIPRVLSQSYPAFKGKQECALKIGIHETFDQETRKAARVAHVEIAKDKLILHHSDSQSKLSQQELADLQKATHFDKKELQQWYKGSHHFSLSPKHNLSW